MNDLNAQAITSAAKVDVEPIWATLLAKVLNKRGKALSIFELI